MGIVKPPFLTARLNRGHPLAQGLVGAWPMNEGGGNTVYDLSGRGNHGTMASGTTWASDACGPSIEGDGTAAAYMTTGFMFGVAPSEFSVCFSYTPYSFKDFTPFIGTYNGWNGFLYGPTAAGTVYCGFNSSNSNRFLAVDIGLALNTANSVCFTALGPEMKLYNNGIFRASKTALISPPAWTSAFAVGGPATDKSLHGLCSYALVYARSLTPSEIAELYADPFVAFRPSPHISTLGGPGAGGMIYASMDGGMTDMTGGFY